MLFCGAVGGGEVREKPESGRKLSDSATVELFRELFSPPGPIWGPRNQPLLPHPDEIPADLLTMTGEGWARVPKYELRYREIRRALNGISGHMYPAQLASLTEYLLTDRLKDLQDEQPLVTWRLVGVLVVESVLTKRDTLPAGGRNASTVQGEALAKFSGANSWDEAVSDGSKVPLPKPPSSGRDQRDAQVVVQLAFAALDPDVQLQAPEHRHQGTANTSIETPMLAYIKSGRQLSKLPTALLNERENATRVLQTLRTLEAQGEEQALERARAKLARLSAEELSSVVGALGVERAAATLGVPEPLLAKIVASHPAVYTEFVSKPAKPSSKGAAKDE